MPASAVGPRFNCEQPAMGWFRDTLMCRTTPHVSLKPEGCIAECSVWGPFQCDQDVHCIDAWAATGMCESKSVSPATPAKNSILKPFGNPRSGLRSVARTCQNHSKPPRWPNQMQINQRITCSIMIPSWPCDHWWDRDSNASSRRWDTLMCRTTPTCQPETGRLHCRMLSLGALSV